MDISKYQEPPEKRGKSLAFVWNFLTMLSLFGAAAIVVLFIMLFRDPQSALNPFPPPTFPVALLLPTSTPITPTATSPTATPTATYTPEPTATNTPRPTATLPPTPTFFTLFTAMVTPTLTEPPVGYPFDVQQGSPIAIANISHPELECSWMGVAGQVFDMSNAPITGLLVRLDGALPGVRITEEKLSLTGAALNYGRTGYYEFTLADEPIASKGTLWVQLLDQAGVPMSQKAYFDTYASCDKNLIILNFKQIRAR